MTATTPTAPALLDARTWRGATLPAVLGVAHLFVDASSNFAMVVLLRPADAVTTVQLLVAYNFGAFALQPLVGLYTDRLQRPRAFLCLGLLLAAAALLALDLPLAVPLLLTSLGNALFHVGAGTIASLATPQRAAGPGVFIAPGAVGVALGAAAAHVMPQAGWAIFAGLLGFAVLGGLLTCPERESVPGDAARNLPGARAILWLLLGAIAIRALLGARVAGQLGLHQGWAIPLAIAAFAGKALGGAVADRLGWLRTAVVALVVSSALLVVADLHPWIAALAVTAFQAVTAITLCALYRVLPGRTGFAFGLACLALFVGVLPLLLRVDLSSLQGIPIDTVLALASLFAVWRALSLLERAPRKPDAADASPASPQPRQAA